VVDTHAHLGLCEAEADELVAAAREAGVGRILTVGIDADSNIEALADAEAHDEVYAAVGRHPNGAADFNAEAADAIEELCSNQAVVAVGETGLDYYRDRAPGEAQRAAFAAQIAIARRVGLPLVIHMRESLRDTFDLLEREAGGVEVILHCFSGGAEWAERAAGNGWYCSFAGNLTYPGADRLREAARAVPGDRLLAETDSPFLAPQSLRGKPNDPAAVIETAQRLAEVREMPYAELERRIEANAARVFGW
jgi:TatD DNase family protein